MQPLYDPGALTDALELDYFQRPRSLHRWLTRCTLVAGGVAAVWALWALWPSNHGTLQAGPVATPHAMFNHDCGKCHTTSFATASRLVPGLGHVSVPDQACLQCHAAPTHNDFVGSDNCASCHKEHRGNAMLARPTDKHCTACHAQLKEQRGEKCLYENVASFAAHPEFAVWRANTPADPGNVEFNHHKHLLLRAEDWRAENRKAPVNTAASETAIHKLQELNCGYCHQPDVAGKYMQPIQYDKHCQACHPLLLPVKADTAPEPLRLKLQAFLKDPVPHPKASQTAWHVRAAVRERYLQFAQGNPGLLEQKPFAMDQWQVLPGLPKRGEPALPSQIAWVNEQWQLAEALFFDKTGCVLCHAEISKKTERPDGLPDFGKPAIPQRWLTHGTFDHQAHRMLDCTSCHKQALASDKRQDVLMPKLESCQSCHQTKAGAARADCVECHQFHHRAGAPVWQGNLTIQDCTKQ